MFRVVSLFYYADGFFFVEQQLFFLNVSAADPHAISQIVNVRYRYDIREGLFVVDFVLIVTLRCLENVRPLHRGEQRARWFGSGARYLTRIRWEERLRGFGSDGVG